jgi:5'-nucleotidase
MGTVIARWALALVLGVLAGCAGPVVAPAAFELNIAHINDHHSHLAPLAHTELVLDGVPTRVELGGLARQATWFKALAGTPHLLKIHAGDATTGTLYHTFFKGQADAALMNTLCFDAFTPGNHEFDDGDAGLQTFLDALARGPCRTVVVSSNIEPAPGTPLAPPGGSHLQPHAVRDIGGVRVGLIGITVKGKTVHSSRPLASTVFHDEVAAAQRAIDALRAQGVRHIVAITHQGYDADVAMAAQLTDVDVIIGGDSHSLLGDFSALGLPTASGPYPTVTANRNGETVCIGQAWEYGKAAGLMQVQFDAQGRVLRCAGQARLLVGERFLRRDASGAWRALEGAQHSALLARLATHQPEVAALVPDAAAAAVLQTYSSRVEAEKARPIGTATESLCLVRVPGESTNPSAGVAGCGQAHTLARGSDVAQAVAEAFLRAARQAQIALQNAGGVRAPVAAGPVTMNTAFTVLPFSNTLVEVALSGAEVVAMLEDAVANHLDLGRSSGSHPYAAGLRWHLDMSRPRGQRFSAVQVRHRETGGWSAIDPTARYVLVTNDFIASGRDGYPVLAAAQAAGRQVNTYLHYTQSFVDDLLAKGTLARPDRSGYSHQRVVTADGVVLP